MGRLEHGHRRLGQATDTQSNVKVNKCAFALM